MDNSRDGARETGPATVSNDQLAATFAPIGWLHLDEEFFTASADDYTVASELLRWSGGDKPHCHPGAPIRVCDLGEVKAESWLRYDSEPSRHRRPVRSGIRPKCGSYQLWLEHKGDPVGSRPTAGRNIKESVYYSVRLCEERILINYWFFFAYSHFGGPMGHQGDWETVSIVVSDGRVQKAYFNSHGVYTECNPGDLRFADAGDRQRLNVYFAKHRHGTYWKAGAYSASGKRVTGPAIDVRTESPRRTVWGQGALKRQHVWFWHDDVTHPHYRWDASDDLVDLASRPWREYSGGWGKRGRLVWTTGPSGPWTGKRRAVERMLHHG